LRHNEIRYHVEKDFGNETEIPVKDRREILPGPPNETQHNGSYPAAEGFFTCEIIFI
jgi:hypothetical protein